MKPSAWSVNRDRGKSTLGRAVLGLAPVSGGRHQIRRKDISHASHRGRRGLARDIQVVFQDPYSSLNPSLTVGESLSEPLRVRQVSRQRLNRPTGSGRRSTWCACPADAVHRLPREFSAVSGSASPSPVLSHSNPALIVCDEPVSALDLTTQARVLDLFLDIQERTRVAYLFVSHDLSVVRVISHRVAVMRHGRIVESGDAEAVTTSPANAYTRQLLLAAPVANPVAQARRRAEYEASRAIAPTSQETTR